MKYRAGTSLFTTTINTATSWSYIYICSQRGGQVAISSIWTQKRRRSSSTRTTIRVEMEERCRGLVAMWALSGRGFGKKMNDHTYCMLHNKKGEASVSGRRRQVRDRRRHKRRINIGAALPKWKSVKVANGFQNNTDVAFFLLDRWVSLSSTGLMNIWRKRWFLN